MRWTDATEELALAVATNLRESDRTEIRMAGIRDPFVETLTSWVHSDIVRGIEGDDGRPVGMAGTRGDVIWLLGTEALTSTPSHRQQLARGATLWVSELRDLDRPFHNWAYAKNVKSLRWLETLGFVVANPAPYGPCQNLFCYFELT